MSNVTKEGIQVRVGQVWESLLDGIRYKVDCNYGDSVGMIGIEGEHHHIITTSRRDIPGPNWKLIKDTP